MYCHHARHSSAIKWQAMFHAAQWHPSKVSSNTLSKLFPIILTYPVVYEKFHKTKEYGYTHYLGPCLGSKHAMMTSTFPLYWSFVRGIHRSPVDSPHKGQWRGALMFSFITNGWADFRDAGDLRRHDAHYDVIAMAKCWIDLADLARSVAIKSVF